MSRRRKQRVKALSPPGPRERAARLKQREELISKNKDLAAKLRLQVDAGEIAEADYWWLLGEDNSD